MLRAFHPSGGLLMLRDAIVLCVGLGAACAVVPTPSAPTYVVRGWRTDDGLPQNAVTAVVQTRDGCIWVGTYSGLARFDGVHFTVFNGGSAPPLRSGRVTSLLEDAAGTLWIGSEMGELTTYGPGGQFQAVPVGPAWGRRKIIALVADADEAIWLADAEGTLMRLKDGLRLEPQAGSAPRLASVAGDRQGHIWVIHNGAASALERGQLLPQFIWDFAVPYVQGICPGCQGGLWVAAAGTLRQIRGQSTNDFGAAPWTSSAFVRQLHQFQRRGRVLVCHDHRAGV